MDLHSTKTKKGRYPRGDRKVADCLFETCQAVKSKSEINQFSRNKYIQIIYPSPIAWTGCDFLEELEWGIK